MKSLFAILLAITALNVSMVSVVYADEALPEIAPVDDPVPPAIDAPAPEEAK